MPMYEYYCRECDTRIEKLRPADARDQPVACPNDATHRPKRLLSVFATMTSSKDAYSASAGPSGGGCACGGHCGCRN
jgi:putative FmdB family regulatory protein